MNRQGLLCLISVFSLATALDHTTIYNLSWGLPFAIVLTIVGVVFVAVVYMVRRARYGAFCCITPRMVIPKPPQDSEAPRQQTTTFGPPSYNASNDSPSTLPPPVYEDALHDAVVMSTVPEETEDEERTDDTTPLNAHPA